MGFGPGGNETGVIVYALPDRVAAALKQSGIDYLTRVPPNDSDSRTWQGRYQTWQETPSPAEPDWVDRYAEPNIDLTPPAPTLANYLNRYGFKIALEPAIECVINGAIARSGSYFAYDRIGVLIVIPETHRVVYAYSG